MRVAVGFLISGRARCTFPGSADSKKSIDSPLNLLSACPKESQGNSLATVLTGTIFTIFTASTKVAAFGHATSFVASFVEAVKIVNIVAVKTVAMDFFLGDSLGRADS